MLFRYTLFKEKIKMKILIILVRMRGGVGRVCLSIKKELEKKGHEVIIIPREGYFGKNKSFFENYKIIRNLVKKGGKNYDIIYTQDWSCTLPLFYPIRLFKGKHFCCFHGHNPKGLSKILQTFVGNKMVNKLFVVGDSLKKRFPKSILNYNGVDRKEFYDLKKKRRYFGWVKTPFEELSEKEVRIIAKRYGLPLIVPKNIPPEKMNKWYNSLKVFASYPPYYTGFNLCWLEAKAAGVPIVLGNDNGAKIKRVNNPSFMKKFTWKNNTHKLLRSFKK